MQTGSNENKTQKKEQRTNQDNTEDTNAAVVTFYNIWPGRQFGLLGFNGTFSTNRLYRAITVG